MVPVSTPTALRAGFVVLAGADTWLAGRPGPRARRARHLTKPLLVPTLAASLLADPATRDSPLRRTTLVAHAAGWAGDVALLRSGTGAFLAGAASFAVGHLAHLTGFVRQRDPAPLAGSRRVRALAATWLGAAPAAALLAGRAERRLAAPVLAYATLLCATAATAGHLGPGVAEDARRRLWWGAVLFLASDAALAVGTFALDQPPAALERAVMATYTAAQLLLTEGTARA
jgi:uncharacterized membrane protein YhhN